MISPWTSQNSHFISCVHSLEGQIAESKLVKAMQMSCDMPIMSDTCHFSAEGAENGKEEAASKKAPSPKLKRRPSKQEVVESVKQRFGVSSSSEPNPGAFTSDIDVLNDITTEYEEASGKLDNEEASGKPGEAASKKSPSEEASEKLPVEEASEKPPSVEASEKLPVEAPSKGPSMEASKKPPSMETSGKLNEEASEKPSKKASKKLTTEEASGKLTEEASEKPAESESQAGERAAKEQPKSSADSNPAESPAAAKGPEPDSRESEKGDSGAADGGKHRHEQSDALSGIKPPGSWAVSEANAFCGQYTDLCGQAGSLDAPSSEKLVKPEMQCPTQIVANGRHGPEEVQASAGKPKPVMIQLPISAESQSFAADAPEDDSNSLASLENIHYSKHGRILQRKGQSQSLTLLWLLFLTSCE